MRRQTKHYDRVERVIGDADGPLSADEIRHALRRTGIGAATVYRHLQRGVEEGRFVPVEMPGGPTRYEPADRPHHHHFECTACGRVYDLEGCTGNIARLLPAGFTAEQHEVLIYGKCDACNAKRAKD